MCCCFIFIGYLFNTPIHFSVKTKAVEGEYLYNTSTGMTFISSTWSIIM